MNYNMSYEEYVLLAEYFNKLSFRKKIQTLQRHSENLQLVLEGSNLRIITTNVEIESQLYNNHIHFDFENNLGAHEIYELLELLEINTLKII